MDVDRILKRMAWTVEITVGFLAEMVRGCSSWVILISRLS